MHQDIMVDIREDDIKEMNTDLLAILLYDRTTRKNIIWGTEDYSSLGTEYAANAEIKPHLITGSNSKVIQPRVLKALEQRESRTRDRAEVFTPSWVCNAQNNLVDDQWFGRENVFNASSGTGWTASTEKISFPEKGSKTWKKYVDAKRLEITCGEAPYLVSRYDSVTGETIPVHGLLDRKLRVVTENTETKSEWGFWARHAVEGIYGYEFQGDNLLLARENILYTYIEHYRDRFDEEPDIKVLKDIALVISWNLWQMDGFNYAIPYCKVVEEPIEPTLFDLYPEAMRVPDYASLLDTKGQALCKIRDWRMKETVLYKDIVTAGNKADASGNAGGGKK